MEITRNARERYMIHRISLLRSNLNIPEIQRLIQPERVDEIYNSIEQEYKQGKEFISPGTLIVAECDNVWYLIDGQHRFIAYLRLLDEHKYDTEVGLNIISIRNNDELIPLFNCVNNTLPVAHIPEGLNRSKCNEILRYFSNNFPKNFSLSRSGNTVRPFIHPTKLEEQIIRLLDFHPTNLLQKLIELNEELKTYNINQFKTSKSDRTDKLVELREKAIQKGGLLFGMFPGFSCFDKLKVITEGTIFKKRHRIVPALRDKVWKIYNGNSLTGKCPFCDCEISKKDCHMAHDLSHSEGGDETVDNLYPCCGGCNLSMGTKTYTEWQECQKLRQK